MRGVLRIWAHLSPLCCAPRQAGGPGDGPSPRHPHQREPPQAHPVAEAAQIPRPGEDGAQPKGIQAQVKAEGSHRAPLCLGLGPGRTGGKSPGSQVKPLRGSGGGFGAGPAAGSHPEPRVRRRQLQPLPAACLGGNSAFLVLWDVSVQHPGRIQPEPQPPTAVPILLLHLLLLPGV